MKRLIAIGVLGCALTGCGSDDPAPATTTAPSSDQPTTASVAAELYDQYKPLIDNASAGSHDCGEAEASEQCTALFASWADIANNVADDLAASGSAITAADDAIDEVKGYADDWHDSGCTLTTTYSNPAKAGSCYAIYLGGQAGVLHISISLADAAGIDPAAK